MSVCGVGLGAGLELDYVLVETGGSQYAGWVAVVADAVSKVVVVEQGVDFVVT